MANKTQKTGYFFRCLSLMLNSGISLYESLNLLKEDESEEFSESVERLCQKVSTGSSFSQALRAEQRFPHFCAVLVEAGEASGTLVKSCDRLADYLERSDHLQKRFLGALIYPILIMAALLVVMALMAWFVFPQEKELLESLGAEIPWLSQLVFQGSVLLFHPYLWCAVALGLVALFVLRSEEGSARLINLVRHHWDRAVLLLPFLGELHFKLCACRSLSVFSTLLESGATVAQSLQAASKMMGNSVLEARLQLVLKEIRDGETLATGLGRHDALPVLAYYVFQVAEETGKLSSMAAHLAGIFEDEVEHALDTLASLLEPLAMLCVGGFVGLVIVATLLPTMNVVSQF